MRTARSFARKKAASDFGLCWAANPGFDPVFDRKEKWIGLDYFPDIAQRLSPMPLPCEHSAGPGFDHGAALYCLYTQYNMRSRIAR